MFEPHLYRLRSSLPLDVCDTFVQGSQLTEKTALDKKTYSKILFKKIQSQPKNKVTNEQVIGQLKQLIILLKLNVRNHICVSTSKMGCIQMLYVLEWPRNTY